MRLELDTLGNIDESLKAEIVEYASLVPFTKGDVLFDYDNTLEFFFIIMNGKVKISQINLNNSKEQTIYMMTKGDMYDTVTLLDGKIHEVLSDVIEPGLVLKIPIEKAREWMYGYPIFGEIVLKYISKQLRDVEELATDLTLFDTQGRLIKLLIDNLEGGGQNNILDGLSHTEIANLIGTVRHVVDRHVKQLKADGILEDDKKTLSFKDREKLSKRAKKLSLDLSLDE